MSKKKILLINPPSLNVVYRETNVRVGTPVHPNIALAIVADPLLKNGNKVELLDMDFFNVNEHDGVISNKIKEFCPDYVGVTAVTPNYYQMLDICKIVKSIDPNIIIVVGGVHVTAFVEETLNTNVVDIIVIGEGDFTFLDIITAGKLSSVSGIAFKDNGQIRVTQPRLPIDNLDTLPYPRWELFEISNYRGSRLVEKASPCGLLETSRGCIYRCCYCNKNIFGYKFRAKSVNRTVDEMEYMLKFGFRQIHIIDDCFSIDLERAKNICEEIIRRRLRFPWTLFNGIRVDNLDYDFLIKLRQAGCWQIAFGIESGSQELLDKVNKSISLTQVKLAIRLAKKAGLETFGFFMLGLPGETQKTLRQTIRFSIELSLDIAKYDFTIPYPNTPLYDQWRKAGYITGTDWSKYICHRAPVEVYKHPNLSWDILTKYYYNAYRAFYLRPAFILKRLIRGIIKGTLLTDIVYFLKTKW